MVGEDAIAKAEALVQAVKAADGGRPSIIAWECEQLARKVREHFQKERPHG